MMFKRLSTAAAFSAVAACVFFISSCGKKGEPTLKTFEKPMPVSSIAAVHREGGLTVSWSYPTSNREAIKGFYIEKAEGDTCAGFRNLAFLKNDAARFVDKEFTTGRGYCYKIRVYSLRDVISDPSPMLKVKPLDLPVPPGGLSYSLTDSSVEVRWESVAADVVYNVYKSYEKGEYPVAPLNSVPLVEPVFEDKLETERPVYYVVRSVIESGMVNEGPPSRELMVDPETFIPSRPSGLKFVAMPRKVHLMWDENPEPWVKRYRVYRRLPSESGAILLGETLTPAFADNTPPGSKAFYYVTAVGPKEESTPSEPVEVSPYVER